MKQYIQDLSSISYRDVAKYGGKSCSLGEMLSAGIPVPTGFAIGVEAQKDFQGKPFSAELKTQISDAYKRHKLKRVAVRSSAIAEDSVDASWAGQLDTFLNVTLEDIEKSVRKCWKSIHSEAAMSYASDKGLSPEDLLVGVTIQSMADSEVSGVMFTVNPVTKNKQHMLIEGLYGLGEMIVQGLVTPDSFLVKRSKTEVLNFEIAIKTKQMTFANGKNRITAVPEALADKAILREAQVIELAKLGLTVERYYKKPQDIEWSFVGGKFYIIQARPITTLASER